MCMNLTVVAPSGGKEDNKKITRLCMENDDALKGENFSRTIDTPSFVDPNNFRTLSCFAQFHKVRPGLWLYIFL